MHPSYTSDKDPKFPQYDLCLMKTEEAIIFDDNTQPICIQKDQELDDNEVFVIAGWGKRFNYLNKTYYNATSVSVRDSNVAYSEPSILQQGMMTQRYNEYYPKSPFYIQLYNVNSGTGSGDSGGPLMALRGDKWIQVGVASSALLRPSTNNRIDIVNHGDFPFLMSKSN